MSARQLDLPVLDAIMSSTARSAFTAVTTAETVQQTWGAGRTTPRPFAAGARDLIRGASVILAPELPELSARNAEDERDILEMFQEYGPQLCPFPVMWIEFTMPGYEKAMPWGAIVNAVEPVEGDDPDKTLMTMIFVTLDIDGVVLMLDVGMMVLADAKTGHVIDLEPMDTSFDTVHRRRPERVTTEIMFVPQDQVERRAVGFTVAETAMRTIGLMNCRNVELARTERPTRQPRKARRKRPDRVAYSTIVLPGTPGHSKYKGDPTADTQPNAKHLVRGHFKRYTEEAPLLGKHVGTYWWGWQTRGSSEHGTVEAQYDARGLEVPAQGGSLPTLSNG